MKYTEQGLIRTIISEPLNCNWLYSPNQIYPFSLKLKMEFLVSDRDKLLIGGMEVVPWLISIFSDKFVTADNSEENVEFANRFSTNGEDKLLIVKLIGQEYILEFLHFAINQLISDSGNKLLSIEII
jgi:hypothetical protein